MSKPKIFEVRGRHYSRDDPSRHVHYVQAESYEQIMGYLKHAGVRVLAAGGDYNPDDGPDFTLPDDAFALLQAAMRETNVEFLTRLMDQAKSGPLMQAFVMQAIDNMARRVAACKPAELETTMVSGEAWKACADELVREIDGRTL